MAKTAEVFAFVGVYPCGCAFFFCTPEHLADSLSDEGAEHLRETMAAGRVRSVMTREEFESVSWKCELCSGDSPR